MKKQEPQKHDFFLSFDDVVCIFKKHLKTILWSTGLFAILGLLYGLNKPVTYISEATFKEKGKSSVGLNKSLSQFLLVGDQVESDALTMMKSRKLMELLAQKLHLQAAIKKNTLNPLPTPVQNACSNILVEYALMRNYTSPILSEYHNDLIVQNIVYKGEEPLSLNIRTFENVPTYVVYDHKQQQIGKGVFGVPFVYEVFSFTLHPSTANVTDSEYTITLSPLCKIAEQLTKQFEILPDRIDKSILKIAYKHPDRFKVAEHIDALMTVYQEYAHKDHQRVCNLQINYLLERQNDMAVQLEKLMQSHANELASDLSTTGFATSSKAIDFLANHQQVLKQKLLATNLEIQRLQNINFEDNSSEFEKIAFLANSEAINKIAVEIHNLKQQSDSLNLATRTSEVDSSLFKESFNAQLDELNIAKQCATEAQEMLVSLDANQMPKRPQLLSQQRKYIVNTWYDKLEANYVALNNESTVANRQNWHSACHAFKEYLHHLMHFLMVYQRNINGRLSQQQSPIDEFQGINLVTAKDLYLTFNKEASAIESEIMQLKYVLDNMESPSFEISALSTILTDKISQELIEQSSQAALAIQDQDNRSQKEQERLKSELDLQKRFLVSHIEQTILLQQLHLKFLKEKIRSLQNITLSLLQEEISILENHLKKSLSAALNNLLREQKLLEANLADLRVEMASFPQKWAAEQLIDQQMEINKGMMEEISKLVESKNISTNLEKIQSAPLDRPITPIHPKSPNLIFLTLIGALAGSFLSFTWLLVQSTSQGITATARNLQAANHHVSGSLTSYQGAKTPELLRDNDLDTLRRLMAFLPTEPSPDSLGHTLLMIDNHLPSQAKHLASLLALKGFKVLVVNLGAETNASHESNDCGLFDYLGRKCPAPSIMHGQHFDTIAAGNPSRYANELISSPLFKELMHLLAHRYEWIILHTDLSPQTVAAQNMMAYFDKTAVILNGETLQELQGCLAFGDKVTYLLTS